MFMALLRTLFPLILFQHPSCWSLLCLQWYFAWCPLVTVNVDSKHPTLSQIPTCLWNGNYQILPGIPIRSIDSPLTKVGDLRNLWSYVFCKGVQMTTVADHLDNAGFNTIAERSLLELMYIINQEKTSLQMDVTAAMLSLSIYRIILPYHCFLVFVFKCVLFVTTALHCSLVLFDVIFVKRPRMLPVQFVTLYKTCKPKPNLNHCNWAKSFIRLIFFCMKNQLPRL